MKPRSPVLGYNHNVRYGAILWHVQTEDSGIDNPHIFTHLFHEGTILSSKKIDYDPSSEVATVQKLMQSQHKLMLRELKAGAFDEKIIARYGPIRRESGDTDKSMAAVADPAEAAPAEAPAPIGTTVVKPKSPEDDRTTVPDLAPLLTPPPARPPTEPAPPPAHQAVQPQGQRPNRPTLSPSRPAIAVSARSGSSPSIPVVAPTPAPPPTIGGRAAARSAPPPTIGSGRSGAAQTNRPTAEGVIVSRPTVIVGKDGGNKQAENFWKTERRAPPEPTFGDNLISEKSLDEVILAYLSEDAPKK